MSSPVLEESDWEISRQRVHTAMDRHGNQLGERLRAREQAASRAAASSQTPPTLPPTLPPGRQMPTPQPPPDNRRMRPRMRDFDPSLEQMRRISEMQNPTPPASESRRTRPRSPEPAIPREQLRRYRDLFEGAENPASSRQGEFPHAGYQLDLASTHLRSLLSTPVLQPGDFAGVSDSAEASRVSKRRKTDANSDAPEFKGFRYGHYGQVEPGKLKMEIESCDGGTFSEEHGANFTAVNVLSDDNSVYCTKGNRCNLVLRHQGGTAFCLQELVIKAPPEGFTAP
jgi:hypothetical protein